MGPRYHSFTDSTEKGFTFLARNWQHFHIFFDQIRPFVYINRSKPAQMNTWFLRGLLLSYIR